MKTNGHAPSLGLLRGSLCLATSVLVFTSSLQAGPLTAIGPFSGTLTETWESFPARARYAGTISIMGGAATLNDPFILISYDRDHSLGSSGLARASDGIQFAYLQGSTRVIDFAAPMNDFGAYWGTFTGAGWPDPGRIDVSFLDASGGLIEAVSFNYSHASTGDGVLDWHGWSSPIGIDRILITSRLQIMMDGLQAQVTVPETGPVGLLLGFGFVGLAACRRVVA